jgi:hypothetical protein
MPMNRESTRRGRGSVASMPMVLSGCMRRRSTKMSERASIYF